MRVLIIEDQDEKFKKIQEALLRSGVDSNSIVRIDNLNDLLRASKELNRFDLCFIDFFLPYRSGEEMVHNCASDILQSIKHSPIRTIPILAISRFASDVSVDTSAVESQGIIVYDYDNEAVWQPAVDAFCKKAKGRHKYDFIGILALEEERAGFLKEPELLIERKIIIGFDAWEVKFEGRMGCLFCLPRMGLVDASIVTSRILSHFEPKVVFMSGICGGSKDAHMGQLLVSEFCWEYQSGKWYSDGFQNTPYQAGMMENHKTAIKSYLDKNADFVQKIEIKLNDVNRPSKVQRPEVGIFASGSAVIASKEKMKTVEAQHRKVKGIDMEIYGVSRCIELLQMPIAHFCCKVVVDKADEDKNDGLHEYGSAFSALASLEILKNIFLSEKTSN